MPDYVAALIVAGSGLLAQVIARFRCIHRREAGCVSGCTEHGLQHNDDNEIDCHKYELHGRDVLVLSAKN